jgi:hypothetical protein
VTTDGHVLPLDALATRGGDDHGDGPDPDAIIRRASELRLGLTGNFRDEAVGSIYDEAERIHRRAVHQQGGQTLDWDQRLDRIVTSPVFGLPLMTAILAVIFWLTIAGANVPSAMLATAFFWVEDRRSPCSRRSAHRGGSPGSCGTASSAASAGS